MPTLDGPTISMGGTDWVVPPLNLKALRKFAPQIQNMKIGNTAEPQHFDLIRDVVHAALVRNYPSLTTDAVDEMLDTKNMTEVLLTVLEASGIERKPVGEA